MFGALAGGATLAVSIYYAYAHGVMSSANAGRFGPRFLIAELGVYLLWLLLVGVVFMAFDIRNGDMRARIAEALDARPVSNVSVITGRALGVVAAVALPVLGTVLVLQILGTLARAADFWMGDPIEPVSLASFVLLDVLVAIFVWCATVLLLSSVLRNRLAVLLAAALLLALQVWAMTTVPVYLLPAVSVVSSAGGWASDITVQFADFDRVLQRSAVLVLGVGICILAAALHPRGEGEVRFRLGILGTAAALVAVAGLATVALRGIGMIEKRDGWLAVHRAAATTQTTARPDIERITGTVAIDPGDRLDLDIDLHLRVHDIDTPSWVFSFNPGLQLTELRHGEAAIPFVHESGLLTIEAGQPMEGAFVLSLRAHGVPDPDFGYLDSAVDWRRRPGPNLLKYLGTEASVFHRNYVALTPAVHWLPTSGSNVDREDPSRRHADFLHLDLVVDVPSGWWVAGPGRQPEAEGAPTNHRLRTDSPIQDVALLASDFERRAVNVQGIELELLLTAKHMPNLDYFAEAGDEITKQLADLFGKLADADLAYPERVLSLVEVPSSLRTYRGGWRMDAVRTPGILLLREEGLPTIRTGYYGREIPADRRQEFLVAGLHIYFLNAWNSGNAYQALGGNLIASTSPVGTGAVALDAVTRDLAYRVLNPWGPETSVWFSAHSYDADAYFGTSVWDTITGLGAGHFGNMLGRTSWWRGDMWAEAGRISLARIEAGKEPHLSFSLMALKGKALEGVLLGTAGVQGMGALLGELRRRHEGRSFAVEDLLVVADEIAPGLAGVVGEALSEPGLPGFPSIARHRGPPRGWRRRTTPLSRYRTRLQRRAGRRMAATRPVRHAMGRGRTDSGAGKVGDRDRQALRRTPRSTLAAPLPIPESPGDPTGPGGFHAAIPGRGWLRWYTAEYVVAARGRWDRRRRSRRGLQLEKRTHARSSLGPSRPLPGMDGDSRPWTPGSGKRGGGLGSPGRAVRLGKVPPHVGHGGPGWHGLSGFLHGERRKGAMALGLLPAGAAHSEERGGRRRTLDVPAARDDGDEAGSGTTRSS